jgi:protoporphyrinogen IX oxidase
VGWGVTYWYAKTFHLIAMVAWMAGLFYLPRLFVYHAEAQGAAEPARGILTAQYAVMESRLLDIIMTPAMVLTFLAGGTMLVMRPETLSQAWFVVKGVLLLGLAGYHGWCIVTARRLARGEAVMSGERFRVMNEVPTVALVLICTYAVLRGNVGLVAGVGISAAMVVLLGVGIQVYAVVRRRKAGRAA